MGEFRINTLMYAIQPKEAIKQALEDDFNKDFLTFLDSNSSSKDLMRIILMFNGFNPDIIDFVADVYFEFFKKSNPLKEIITGEVLDTGKKDTNGRAIVQLQTEFLN